MRAAAFSRRVAPALVLAMLCPLTPSAAPQKEKSDKDKPALTVKASPMMGFSPAKIVFTAELKGGANDYEDYYCPTVEWEWGDDTRSEASLDCEPYEAGKSEIKRRFTAQHEFKSADSYKVSIRLKKKSKAMIAAHVTVQVRPGIRDPGR